MGHYASLHFYQQPPSSCTTCGMEIKNPRCCHDEVKIIKLDNLHQHSSLAYKFEDVHPFLSSICEFFTIRLLNDEAFVNQIAQSPPLVSRQDTYLQNRVFKI